MAVIKFIRKKTAPVKLKFTQEMYDTAVKVWRDSIQEFLVTVAPIVADHQDTGMSYASLFPLAAKLNSSANLPPLSPKTSARKPFTTINGHKQRNTFKTAALGMQLGEKSATIGYGTKSNPQFSFRFKIRVWQYLLNEIGAGNISGAFNSVPTGIRAMRAYLDAHAPEVAKKIKQYFKTTRS